MRHSTTGLACAGFVLVLLSACGSDAGGDSNTPPPGTTPVPVVSLSATPTSITAGGSTTLGWSSTNATGCTASGGWSGAKAASGNEVVSNITVATTYSLSCTGAGGTSTPAVANVTITVPTTATTANAGQSRTVFAGSTVRLSGESSSDPEGDVLQYIWTQTDGTSVTLTAGTTATPTFTAPAVTANTALTFSLVVSDGTHTSTASTVTITVAPVVAGNVLVTGRITYVRIPFSTSNLNVGLNYSAPVNRPARGIVVNANSAALSTLITTGETDTDGNFALSVPQNTLINLFAVARLSRDSSVSLPRWNFTVVDVDAAPTAAYTFTDGAFSTSTGVSHDMNVPSGFNTAGAVTGTRASAPFAILDTVYSGVQTILGVAPATNFPALRLDWAPNNPGGETFFDSGSGGFQQIVLSADPTEDTDEFDQHVIAHEFGHYIEFNFSRADNIGGSHGIGDKLDIRVAFGEGFGYAFAAIALNDPIARDSFVNAGQQVSSTFNVESNPAQNPPGSPTGNFGCWCSESSVWSILWDMFDGNPDNNDTVALGFKPMWEVLINQQRTTPAMTSIFSFTTALKESVPGQSAAIDALLAGQNITSAGLDALGSTETHVPTPVASAAALPVYTTLTAGSPVTLRSGADAGTYNTLGNHRFVRYVKNGSASQTVSVSSPTLNADPDAIVYRNGTLINVSEDPGSESFAITTAGTYIFDVYECANGCTTPQGTPGNYDITVAVN